MLPVPDAAFIRVTMRLFLDLSKDCGSCFIFITKSWRAISVPVLGNHAEICELGGSQTEVFCVKQRSLFCWVFEGGFFVVVFFFKVVEEQKNL